MGSGSTRQLAFGAQPERADLRARLPKRLGSDAHTESAIRRRDWIALLLHYVINPARWLTTYNRRSVRLPELSRPVVEACRTA